MLTKPDVQDVEIVESLRQAYGLKAIEIDFLPLGADPNAAVYRARMHDQAVWFVKLRRGGVDDVPMQVAHALYAQGIREVVAPLRTKTGVLSTTVQDFTLTVYPFVAGRNGFEVALSPQQWAAFGRALRQVHSAVLPPELVAQIPHETYSPIWREMVAAFQVTAAQTAFDDPIRAALASLLQAEADNINRLVAQAAHLAVNLQAHPRPSVPCHTDIHAGNLLINPDGIHIAMVDWDAPLMAPKERDLMFIGAGIGGIWNTPQESALFYQGYGETTIDPIALAYYRCARVVEDIAVYCRDIFGTSQSADDRAEGLRQLSGQFRPGSVVEIALESTHSLAG
ncbi:MAG: aminoglycoside phosphotransferase family protein [bacterium]|nr:aminoglycoside phosphotransferase family protein [bacterium]